MVHCVFFKLKTVFKKDKIGTKVIEILMCNLGLPRLCNGCDTINRQCFLCRAGPTEVGYEAGRQENYFLFLALVLILSAIWGK